MKSNIETAVAYPLSTGGQVLVFESDLPLLEGRTWCRVKCHNHFYAAAHEGKKSTNRRIYMHRLLLGVVGTKVPFVDHLDGDGLNNARSNLRLATREQNAQNCRQRKVGYRGVFKQGNGYIARAGKIYGGFYQDAWAAALAYDRIALKHWGVHARVNFGAANDG